MMESRFYIDYDAIRAGLIKHVEAQRPDRSDADILRAQLESIGLSQRMAARELCIPERTMRRYCAGQLPIPSVFKNVMKLYLKLYGSPQSTT